MCVCVCVCICQRKCLCADTLPASLSCEDTRDCLSLCLCSIKNNLSPIRRREVARHFKRPALLRRVRCCGITEKHSSVAAEGDAAAAAPYPEEKTPLSTFACSLPPSPLQVPACPAPCLPESPLPLVGLREAHHLAAREKRSWPAAPQRTDRLAAR